MLIGMILILIFLSFISTILALYLNQLKKSKFDSSLNPNSSNKSFPLYNPPPEKLISNEERRKNIILQPDRKIIFNYDEEEEENLDKIDDRDFQNLSFEKVDVVTINKEKLKKLGKMKKVKETETEDREEKRKEKKTRKLEIEDLDDLKDFQYYEKFVEKLDNEDENGKYYTIDRLMDDSSEVSNYKTDNSGYLVSLNSTPNKKPKIYDVRESMDLSVEDPTQKGDWNERFQKSVKMMREFTTNTPLRRRIRVWRDLINLSQDL